LAGSFARSVVNAITDILRIHWNLAEHVKNLKEMRQWDIAKIFPNHGDPDVIVNGGYDKTFIDATASYITKVLTRSHDVD
jgi:cyclase